MRIIDRRFFSKLRTLTDFTLQWDHEVYIEVDFKKPEKIATEKNGLTHVGDFEDKNGYIDIVITPKDKALKHVKCGVRFEVAREVWE